MKEGRIDLSGVRKISREHFIEWTKKAKPQAHDVVLSRRCNPGVTAHVPAGLEMALGQNLVLLRADGSKLHPPFLRWLVSGQEWWDQVGKFINVGAVFESLRCRDIPNFELTLPPLSEQKRIAHILSTLDDKIELNRRMNATLEAMARALFQSWFVDFDPVKRNAEDGTSRSEDSLFPSSFDEAPGTQVPEGWELVTLKDLTEKIGSGSTPRGGSAVYVEEGVALIRSQNVHDHEFRWQGIARLTDKSADELSNVEVQLGDVLLNITGDSILRTCVVDPSVLPARVNQHVAIIRAKAPVPNRYLHLYLVQQRIKDFLIGLNTGATRQAVTKGNLETVPVLHPSLNVLDAFEKAVSPLFRQIESNNFEARTLANLRDTLLPKLLRGDCDTIELQVIA